MSKLSELLSSKNKGNLNHEELKSELYILSDKLKKHEQDFNMADNDDLIEALVYEQKALQARFSFLMKQAREKGLEINFFDRF